MRLFFLLLLIVAFGSPSWARAATATVLFGDRVIKLEQPLIEAANLWVEPEDLTKINGCEIKAEGVCIGGTCIPITAQEKLDLFRKQGRTEYVNLTKLAKKLHQEVVNDGEERVWSFGPIAAAERTTLQTLTAPDFTLTDRQGKEIRLRDYRGRKVLLLTWASW